MIGEFEAMGQASDSFASIRQPSLDFVFVSLTFRRPFVVFRQFSFHFSESSLFNRLRASGGGKICEPEAPAAVASPAPVASSPLACRPRSPPLAA